MPFVPAEKHWRCSKKKSMLLSLFFTAGEIQSQNRASQISSCGKMVTCKPLSTCSGHFYHCIIISQYWPLIFAAIMWISNPRRLIHNQSSGGRWVQIKCVWNLDVNAFKGESSRKSVQRTERQISTFAPSWVGHSCHFSKSGAARVSSATAACSPPCRPGTRGRGPPRRAAGDTRTSQWVTHRRDRSSCSCSGRAANSRLFLSCPVRASASSCCCRCRPHISEREHASK